MCCSGVSYLQCRAGTLDVHGLPEQAGALISLSPLDASDADRSGVMCCCWLGNWLN